MKSLHYPYGDSLVIVWDIGNASSKFFVDIEDAIARFNIDPKRYRIHKVERNLFIEYFVEDPITKEVVRNKLVFKHAKAGFESLKGSRPLHGHGWVQIIIFEPTNFYRFNMSNLEELLATYIRDALYLDKNGNKCAKDHPEAWTPLEIAIETNTPKRGTVGLWVNKVIEYAKNSGDPMWHYQFNDYRDFWDASDVKAGIAPYDEKSKYLGKLMINRIENTKKYNYTDYLETYLGRIDMDNMACYKNIKPIHLGRHEIPYDNIIDICVGLDVGHVAATSICATLIWFDQDTGELKIQEGYKLWYHSSKDGVFEKWNWDTENESDAIQNYQSLHPFDACLMIKQFLEELHEEFPNNRITYNGEYAGAGNEWYEILFSVDKNGYSLLTNQYGAWSPYWLEVNKTWDKDDISIRISAQDYLFCYPGCYKTHCKRLWKAYNEAYFDLDGKRNDDPKNDWHDIIDSAEYKWDRSQWVEYQELILRQLERLSDKKREDERNSSSR